MLFCVWNSGKSYPLSSNKTRIFEKRRQTLLQTVNRRNKSRRLAPTEEVINLLTQKVCTAINDPKRP